MAEIEFDDVVKRYPDGFEAVKNMNLGIRDGEFVILVGPSGCGKSTALRMIAGLEDISDGELIIGGETVNDLAPKDRDIAMVFQNYALYPHMTVRDNMGFALKLAKTERGEIDRKVTEAARILDLEQHLERKPANLSGGQRQRVAMGRAIVRDPKAFLMDEPLSNLDAKLRVQMRTEVARIQKRLGTTMVYVTHDQTEAMTLGDRVAVVRAGVLQQIASPQDLYDQPVDMSVAGFIGAPAMNMVIAEFDVDDAGRAAVSFGGHRLAVPEIVLRRRPALQAYAGRRLVLGIRPEDMDDALVVGGPEDSTLDSVADLVEAMGADVMVHFPVAAEQARTEERETLDRESGHVRAAAGGALLVGRFSPRTRIFEGQPVTVRVDTEGLHFFDRGSGRSIWR